jgi:hypothetical protein
MPFPLTRATAHVPPPERGSLTPAGSRRRIDHRNGILALALLTALIMPACSSTGEQDEDSQSATAEAFYACLVDAGLPATMEDAPDGGTYVQWPQEGYDIYANIPVADAQTSALWAIPGRSHDYENTEPLDAFLERHPTTEYGLEIDGVDHSAAYADCHRRHPYQDPNAEAGPTEELRGKQLLADATNEWIACARDHGLPDLTDVTAGQADNWLTSPMATVPLTTTPDALRQLLAACPNFDADQAARREEPGYDESAFVPDPAIQPADPRDESERERYEALIATLNEASDQFYAARAAQGTEE